MKAWHIGVFILWLILTTAMVIFSGSIRIPTKIFSVGGFTTTIKSFTKGYIDTNTTALSLAKLYATCSLPIGKLKPEPLQMAKSHCRDSQDLFYNSGGKSTYWGHHGLNKFMDSIFNKPGNKNFFTFHDNRPINVVHIGAHLGNMMDAYSRLRRGPRLDDRIILFEPNPANYDRLVRRVRLDPRLVLTNQAISNEPGRQWFSFSSVPNTLGNSGKLQEEKPEDAQEVYIDPSLSKEEQDTLKQKQTGYYVNVTTLDVALKSYPVIDFIFMDPEAWEPRIFLGAKETLAKTRMMAFGCSSRWVAHSKITTNKRIFQYLQDLGFTIVLLGKEQHLLINEDMGPDRIYDRLNAWGFCAAIRFNTITPEINITALSQSISGHLDGPLKGTNSSFCLRYVAASLYNTCEENRKQKGSITITTTTSSSPPNSLRG